MSLSAAIIDALLDSGATREQIAAAVKADIAEREAVAAAKLEKKRSGNRERQQRKRDNDRNAESRVTGVTERDTVPPDESILTPSGSQKPSPSGEVKKFPEPAGVTAEQWQAFRKQRKKPLNAHSYTLLTNKLAKLAEDGWPPGDMIDLAIERGWETVFAPRNFGNVQRRDSPSPLDQLVAASLGYGAGACESS